MKRWDKNFDRTHYVSVRWSQLAIARNCSTAGIRNLACLCTNFIYKLEQFDTYFNNFENAVSILKKLWRASEFRNACSTVWNSLELYFKTILISRVAPKRTLNKHDNIHRKAKTRHQMTWHQNIFQSKTLEIV